MYFGAHVGLSKKTAEKVSKVTRQASLVKNIDCTEWKFSETACNSMMHSINAVYKAIQKTLLKGFSNSPRASSAKYSQDVPKSVKNHNSCLAQLKNIGGGVTRKKREDYENWSWPSTKGLTVVKEKAKRHNDKGRVENLTCRKPIYPATAGSLFQLRAKPHASFWQAITTKTRI